MVLGPNSGVLRRNKSAAIGGRADPGQARLAGVLLTQCMVRPCVARSFVDLVFGLASMYPASDWSVFCSGPPWISARGRSHYRTGLDWAIWVTSVRSRREDRSPSRRYLSQTSAGKRLSASLLRHRQLLISSVPWFVLMAVPSSRPAPSTCDARRCGQGRSARAARRAWP